jgi:hypothetical protein
MDDRASSAIRRHIPYNWYAVLPATGSSPMMRHLRLLGSIFCAAVVALGVAAPAIAQTPVTDQYLPAATHAPTAKHTAATGATTSQGDSGSPPGSSTATDRDNSTAAARSSGGSGGSDGAGGVLPVTVQAAQGSRLPFTGGSVPLVAMLGLGLLAAALVGYAVSRRRGAARSS